MVYNEISPKYKTTIDITEDMLYANIYVNSLNIYYIVENEIWVRDGDVSKAIADITDNNGVYGDKMLVLLNVNFAAEYLRVRDNLHLLVYTKDEISGIEKIKIEYVYENYWHQEFMEYDYNLKNIIMIC